MELNSPNEKEGSLSGGEVLRLFSLLLTNSFIVIGLRDKILISQQTLTERLLIHETLTGGNRCISGHDNPLAYAELR